MPREKVSLEKYVELLNAELSKQPDYVNGLVVKDIGRHIRDGYVWEDPSRCEYENEAEQKEAVEKQVEAIKRADTIVKGRYEIKNDESGVGYDIYLNERRALIDDQAKGRQQFDKAILTLAAGALAISITFIKNIAPYPVVWTIPLLWISWIALLISVLLTLFSFFTSESAFSRQLSILENIYSGKQDDQKNPMRWLTGLLNWLSIGTFVCGVACLAVFSMGNIESLKEKKMAEDKQTETLANKVLKELEKGVKPPVPPKKKKPGFQTEGVKPPQPPQPPQPPKK